MFCLHVCYVCGAQRPAKGTSLLQLELEWFLVSMRELGTKPWTLVFCISNPPLTTKSSLQPPTFTFFLSHYSLRVEAQFNNYLIALPLYYKNPQMVSCGKGYVCYCKYYITLCMRLKHPENLLWWELSKQQYLRDLEYCL